jgi:hypothetical protein
VESAVQPCPYAAAAPRRYWIEIELAGEDGRPIPWEAYRIELPNGETATGYLDGNGRARIENIADSGDCKVSFPAVDQDAWDRNSTT